MVLADGARMSGARPESLVAAAHVATVEMLTGVEGTGWTIEREVSDDSDQAVALRRTP